MRLKKLTIALFFSMLIVIPTVSLLLPKKEFSEMENRKLTKWKNPTVDNVFNKSFMSNIEKYMADHIIFRNQFAESKTVIELAQGKSEVNDVYITDDMLIENVKPGDKTITAANIQAINNFATKYTHSMKINLMIVPTAAEFYESKLPIFATSMDQTTYIQDVYSKVKIATCVDAYAALSSKTDDYIFYRTDHHWTSYGAYLGYTALAKNLGFKPISHDLFNIEYVSDDFLGSLYSKCIYGKELKDDIDLYHYAKGEAVTNVIRYENEKEEIYPSIFFKENLEKKDKYTVFLGQNEPVVKIQTNVGSGKKLLVFKDSFANSMMQFLPMHYDEIAVVDLRYLNKDIKEYVNLYQYDQALFLYNVQTFLNDTNLNKINNY